MVFNLMHPEPINQCWWSMTQWISAAQESQQHFLFVVLCSVSLISFWIFCNSGARWYSLEKSVPGFPKLKVWARSEFEICHIERVPGTQQGLFSCSPVQVQFKPSHPFPLGSGPSKNPFVAVSIFLSSMMTASPTKFVLEDHLPVLLPASGSSVKKIGGGTLNRLVKEDCQSFLWLYHVSLAHGVDSKKENEPFWDNIPETYVKPFVEKLLLNGPNTRQFRLPATLIKEALSQRALKKRRVGTVKGPPTMITWTVMENNVRSDDPTARTATLMSRKHDVFLYIKRQAKEV